MMIPAWMFRLRRRLHRSYPRSERGRLLSMIFLRMRNRPHG
ncbi:hypothetical protein C816_03574 [Oscillibacter sp. 1-3]|nr:hypothetical protein C816_03574 [Oscillibacter sp. 1-3]